MHRWEGPLAGPQGPLCLETKVKLHGEVGGGHSERMTCSDAVYRKSDTHQRRHQGPSGSGGLFSGACNRPDNEIFAEFLKHGIL